MTTRYYPTRGGANRLNRYTKTLLASALILAFSSAQALVLTPPADPNDWNGPGRWHKLEEDPNPDSEINEYTLESGSATFDSITASIHPLITNSEFSLLPQTVRLLSLPALRRLSQLQPSSTRVRLTREHIPSMQIAAKYT